MAAGSSTVAKSLEVRPAQRCASSAIARSKLGDPSVSLSDTRRGLVGTEDDRAAQPRALARNEAMSAGRWVTGMPSSLVVATIRVAFGHCLV